MIYSVRTIVYKYTEAYTKMQNANSIQVGGDHYRRHEDFQHWDFALAMHMRYLEGNATKYISRFVYKGGTVDLQKALHYIDKIIEVHKANNYPSAQSILVAHGVDVLETSTICARFATAQGLSHGQSMACRALASWQDWHDLCYARERVRCILAAIEREPQILDRMRAAANGA